MTSELAKFMNFWTRLVVLNTVQSAAVLANYFQ